MVWPADCTYHDSAVTLLCKCALLAWTETVLSGVLRRLCVSVYVRNTAIRSYGSLQGSRFFLENMDKSLNLKVVVKVGRKQKSGKKSWDLFCRGKFTMVHFPGSHYIILPACGRITVCGHSSCEEVSFVSCMSFQKNCLENIWEFAAFGKWQPCCYLKTRKLLGKLLEYLFQ